MLKFTAEQIQVIFISLLSLCLFSMTERSVCARDGGVHSGEVHDSGRHSDDGKHHDSGEHHDGGVHDGGRHRQNGGALENRSFRNPAGFSTKRRNFRMRGQRPVINEIISRRRR